MTIRVSNSVRSMGLLLVLIGTLQPLRADEAPLAWCELVIVPTAAPQGTNLAALAVLGNRTSAEEASESYQHDVGADWNVPAEVDPDDPAVRLLLLAPTGPVVIEMAIYTDGQPFRSIRETWIDELLTTPQPQTQGDATLPASPTTDRVTILADQPALVAGDADETESEPASETTPAGVRENTPAGVRPTAHSRPPARTRLANYIRDQPSPVGRDEARWLLAQWSSGPALVTLRPGFGWERAAYAPLLAALDEDSSGTLSRTEMSSARGNLDVYDLNEDNTIELAEITQLATSAQATAGYHAWKPRHLLIVLEESTDWVALSNNIARVYAQSLVEPFLVPASDDLLHSPADVVLRVDFSDDHDPQPGLRLVRIAEKWGAADKILHTGANTVTLDQGAYHLEFSAGRPADHATAESTGQVAVGAVIDGYPLFRCLDGDGDSSLSLREVNDLERMLASFDLDQDGELSATELPTPIRLVVTDGPHAHTLLSVPVPSAIRTASQDVAATPDWFRKMDTSGDGDLTPQEFLGTAAQFEQFDTDRDGLINVREATASQ